MRAEADVASRARVARGGISEVAEKESAPATGGVRVLLHRLELSHVSRATPVELLPDDPERRERPAHIGNAKSSSAALPHDELTVLERIEEHRDAERATQPGGEAVGIDRDSIVAARATDTPDRAEQIALRLEPLAELRFDAERRGEQSNEELRCARELIHHGARLRENPKGRFHFPLLELSACSRRNIRRAQSRQTISIGRAHDLVVYPLHRGAVRVRRLDKELVCEAIGEGV
jgi:hypothetical protein